MSSNNRNLRKSVLCIALGACLSSMASMALAANNDGSVVGHAPAGATITITSPDTGFSRSVTADSDGNYRFSFLPVGDYTVQSSAGGAPVGVTVSLGNATNVDLSGSGVTTLGGVQVVGSNVVSAVDVTSTESATNVTREELARLPVDQNITSVALLAPGVQKGNSAFGGISFGGSSVAENSFYINGLNVTDFYNRNGFSSAPFAFYREFQVKTGGYSVEFGRTTGGVINAVTRSGSNDFHAGAELTLEPRGWQSERQDHFNADGTRYITSSQDNYDLAKLNVFASGPVIRDRLFFFAMYEGRDNEPQNTNNAGTTLTKGKSDDAFWGAKVDWQVTDSNLLELMAFSDKNTGTSTTYGFDFDREELTDEGSEPIYSETGGVNWNATWTSYLTDALSMKLMYGETERNNSQYSASDLECSNVRQEVKPEFPAPSLQLGCTTSSRVESRLDERTAMRADFEWQLDDHLLRFGLDHEENVSNYNRHYPGPDQTFYNIYYLDVAGSEIPDTGGATLPPGEHAYVRARQYGVNGQFESINSAWYVEDNWQVTPNLLLNLGVRMEAFDNKDSDGNSYIKIDDMLAPRFGFSWDMKGDGSSKLFGNVGRYFLPVANVINIKQAGGFLDARTYYAFDGYREETRNGVTYLMPILGEQLGFDNSQGDGTVGDLRSEVDRDIDPVYQDELILGYEQMLTQTWSWGISGTYRKLHNAIDDMEISATPQCGEDGYVGWVMANPGEEVTVWGDTDCDGENDGYITIDTSKEGYGLYDETGYVGQTGWVKPRRTYKAIELQIDRAWDDKWAFNASYTWSKSEGNAEGPVNSDTNFDDTGRTENFDDPWVNYNGDGPLANDRKHQIKLRGAYAFNDNWRLGATLNAQSGGPITGFGVGNPFDRFSYHSYYICVENCTSSDTSERVYQLSPRGGYGRMPWTFNLGASITYARDLGPADLAVKFAVYNILNQQHAISVDQDLQESVSGGTNSNFLRETSWQSPAFAQLTVSLNF